MSWRAPEGRGSAGRSDALPPAQAARAASSGGASGLAPEAAADYSPYSNPYGERPPLRTSAGMVARLSGASLPTPGAFTPQSAAASDWAAATPSYGSGLDLLTPNSARLPSDEPRSQPWGTPGPSEGAGSSSKPGGSGGGGGGGGFAFHAGVQQAAAHSYQQQLTPPQPSPGSWLTGAPVGTPSEITPTSFGSRHRAAAAPPSPSQSAGSGGGPAGATPGAATAAAAAMAAAAPAGLGRPPSGQLPGQGGGWMQGSSMSGSQERAGVSPSEVLLRKVRPAGRQGAGGP
jgi:hypothetical protein